MPFFCFTIPHILGEGKVRSRVSSGNQVRGVHDGNETVNFQLKANRKMDGFDFLGLGNYTTLVKNIEIQDWGQTVVVDCIYDPVEKLPYRIIFSNCKKIKWFFEKSQIDCICEDNHIDIIDFQVTEKSENKEALLFAHVIELLITCENIVIRKDW